MKNKKSVLVVDGTGRGHALCEFFVRTNPEVIVYYGPGSEVIDHNRIKIIPEIKLDDVDSVLEFCKRKAVDFVFVSFIESLIKGFVDTLRRNGIKVIGPTARAAELEASKARTKKFCKDHNIATGEYRAFNCPEKANKYISSLNHLVVVKVDGLCEVSDGVTVCDTKQQAINVVDKLALELDNFTIIVEKRLHGMEISIFALLDGDNYLLFPYGFDYKKVYDGDKGKNCDGMGSIAPHPYSGIELDTLVNETILKPLMLGLKKDALDYSGFIYVGGMLTDSGLEVIEINARFGDSEAEAVLPSVHNDFYQICVSTVDKKLSEHQIVTDGYIRCCVAATQCHVDRDDKERLPGWPFGSFRNNQKIIGLNNIDSSKAEVFIAGAKLNSENEVLTHGGRVFHVVGKGMDLISAKNNAYEEINKINFNGMRYRKDIGQSVENMWPRRSPEIIKTDWISAVSYMSSASKKIHFFELHKSLNKRNTLNSAILSYVCDERTVDSVLYTFTIVMGRLVEASWLKAILIEVKRQALDKNILKYKVNNN